MNDAESVGAAGCATHYSGCCVIGLTASEIGAHREIVIGTRVVVIGHKPINHVRCVEEGPNHV